MCSEYRTLEMCAVMLSIRRMDQGDGQSNSLDLLLLVRWLCKKFSFQYIIVIKVMMYCKLFYQGIAMAVVLKVCRECYIYHSDLETKNT